MNNFKNGFKACLVLAANVVVFGIILGGMANQKDFLWFELLMMNLFVFAGSAQFLIVEMWNQGNLIGPVLIAVMIINLRYILITATIAPLFRNKPLFIRLLSAHLTADENWALTLGRYKKKPASIDIFFLLGSGVCLFLSWNLSVLAGFFTSLIIPLDQLLVFDFIIYIIFTLILTGFYEGRKNIVPWVTAAAVAILSEYYLPGQWYIILGGISGAIVQVIIESWNRRKFHEDI